MIETSNSNHPAANFETDLLKSHRRGALAIGALGLTALVHVADIGISAWQNSLISQAQQTPGSVAVSVLELSDALTVRVSLGILGLLLVTGVLFLRWLRQVGRTGK